MSRASNENALLKLSATAKAFEFNISDTNLNVSYIRRWREIKRKTFAIESRGNFVPDKILNLHWDGKIVKKLTGTGNVDRQAVIVAGEISYQLLGIPPLEQGSSAC